MLRALENHPADRPALILAGGDTVTFGELDERAARLACVLTEAGIGAGDRIAALCGNTPRFFEVAAACGHLGIRWVPVNWHWAPREVAYVLADSGAKALIVDAALDDLADSALLIVEGTGPPLVLGDRGRGDTDATYDRALDDVDLVEPAEQLMGGPMFYTSGTTGFPKGVVAATDAAPIPATTLQPLATGVVKGLAMVVGGTQLLCGPAYHSAQFTWAVLPVFAGNTVVVHERFDAAATLRAIDEHRVSGVHLVPTQMLRLLRLPDPDRETFDGSSLAAVWHGAAPCPRDVKQSFIDWFGQVVWEYYGGTEGGLLSTVSSETWLQRPGTVGRIAAGYDVAVTDEAGEPCPPGTPGQIWFRRSTGDDFAYHNAPEKTASAHRDGWATLGDIGSFDDDGYLYLSDRAIDMIISGGVNIYPAEIEACLLQHEAVTDIGVYGVPDEEFGESVRAAVELDPHWRGDRDAAIAAISAHARANLAGYKVPKAFDIVDTLPRMASGKLQKRFLREAHAERAATAG